MDPLGLIASPSLISVPLGILAEVCVHHIGGYAARQCDAHVGTDTFSYVIRYRKSRYMITALLEIVEFSRLVQKFDPHTLPPRSHSLNHLTERLAMFGPAKFGYLGIACIGQIWLLTAALRNTGLRTA